MSSLTLVLTDDRLLAYQQRLRDVTFIGEVAIEAELDSFLAKLYKQYRAYCCKLILDRSDEEFVLENLPAMHSSMHKRAIGIKLTRHFSVDAFTVGIAITGKRGEASDAVLCAGIEKKQSLQHFMQAIERQGIVFQSVYSLAILLANQSKSVQCRTGTLLLLSSQKGGVWRYSLIKSGNLLLSRCVFIGDRESIWEEVISEHESTRAYANRIVEEQETITTVYAGPDPTNIKSPAGKLIASLSRHYRLFRSDDLYREVLSNSRFTLCRSPAYVSRKSNHVYCRYLFANISIVASIVFFLMSIIYLYSAIQYSNDIAVKTKDLRKDFIEDTGDNIVNKTGMVLPDLNLIELRKIVEVFAPINLNDEVRELEYRLAVALNKHPLLSLLAISFVKQGREDAVKRSDEPNVLEQTILTAKFHYTGDESESVELARFLLAIEEVELQLVQSGGNASELSKKGEIGVAAAKQENNATDISVTVALKVKS